MGIYAVTNQEQMKSTTLILKLLLLTTNDPGSHNKVVWYGSVWSIFS